MKTKQQVIDEAYFNFDNEKNDLIDSDGWATYGVDENSEFGIEPFGEYETRNHVDGVFEWRPLSLQGIETNNNWIVIQSEAQFDEIPNGNYLWYNIENGDWEIGDLPICGKYTHYQPVIMKNPPLHS
jgi:hypothetical protein